MPYVHVSTTAKLDYDQKEALFEKIAELMPMIPGKTYDNTMIHIDSDCYIRKGDRKECLMMDIHIFNPSPEEAKKAFCEAVMQLFEKELGIPVKAQAVNITTLDHWASSGVYR